MTEKKICNRCFKKDGDESEFGATRVTEYEQHWGYASFYKDGYLDNFNLCYECLNELKKHWSIFCSYCGEKVRVVAAELSNLAPRYYAKSLEDGIEKDSCYIDTDFGQIGQYPLCEVCYEQFVLSLPIPPNVTSYMQNPPTVAPLTENRVQNGIEGKDIVLNRKKYPRRFREEYPTCPKCDLIQSDAFKYCPIDGSKLNYPSTHRWSAFPPSKHKAEPRPEKEDSNYKREIITIYISVPTIESERNATFLDIPKKLDIEYFSRGSFCSDSNFYDYPTEPGVHKCKVEFWELIDEEKGMPKFETTEDFNGNYTWKIIDSGLPLFGFHVLESEKVFDLDAQD